MNSGSNVGLGNPIAPLSVLSSVLLLTACGGGSGSGNDATSPILQVGMQRQYVGTVTRNVTYTNPTATLPDNNLAYSFTESQTVMQAASGTGADFDVNTIYAYTVTQDPGIGTVPISQTVDTYENLLASGGTQMTQTVGQHTVVANDDETSNALGGGPYTQTTTTSSTFPTARDGFSYPLQAGASMNVPQSSAQTITFADANASGDAPPNGSNLGYSRTRTENTDGSFSFQTAYVGGTTQDFTQNADGSGSYTTVTATASTTTTLGLPVSQGGTENLPVTRSVTPTATGVVTTTDYTAADWYPTDGHPNSPLVLQAETVVGPTSDLPAECNGAVLRPSMYEIDTTTTNQDTVSPSYAVTKTRAFVSDGVTVCSLQSVTSYSYALLTGELVSTTTTQTQTLLNSINY